MSSIPDALRPARSVPADPRPPLRLSASRGHLALELASPLVVGPLRIVELIATIDGLRFPIDLTGGVSRFRHRRGSLQRVVVEVSLPLLARALTPNVRQALANPNLHLHLLPSHHGVVVGAHDHRLALAFQAVFAPADLQPRWVITQARAVGVGVPAHAAALRIAQAIFGKHAQRHGSAFALPQALPRLVGESLLDAGARLPSMHDVRFTTWEETQDGFRLTAQRNEPALLAPPHVIRAVELSRISSDADDALVSGDLPRARDLYLHALESAPRHPDLAVRLAELDLLAGNSGESALASIVEALPAIDGGLVASQLLSANGDCQAALVAALRAAHSEPYSPLAALMFSAAAAVAPDAAERLALLDEAVARAPSGHAVRWTRAQTRIALGRTDDAVADLGHLVASASSTHLKLETCMRAGQLLLDARTPVHARRFFERALRYAPASASASAGLAKAFLALNDHDRGVGLLSRAVSLTERTANPDPDLLLDLARSLAEHVHDLPSAVYHARAIPFGSPQTVAARALEGRWRDMLGDSVGASLAYAQAREAIEVLPPDAARPVAPWLLDGARYELLARGNASGARRFAELALRFLPNNSDALELFRSASAALARAKAPEPHAPADPSPTQLPTPQPPLDEAGAELRVVQLTDRIRANPNDAESTVELCSLLERMERYLDLMALVSARLDEELDPDRLRTLRDYYRIALTRLAMACRADGRNDEAQIYEDVLATLDADTPT